ncbi:MAG: pyrimidine-nucleoside phosphorylase [Firmicutes bacterium]|nr:pyrimidine-nucleoside phosphorylase [Bacillota bacterium]
MRVDYLLAKKRDGIALSADELEYLVKGFVSGEIPDYQMSAFLMAAYIRGMNEAETFALTKSMVESGDVIDLSSVEGIKVDKHSTGGVGDKITLILGPMMAAVGLKVAKMSGRGLGFTGGTLDKLESIPGFNVNLTKEQFVRQVNEIGIAIMGQTQEIDPADKKMYALRDVTATVSSVPLIASSIMSKKVAGGADAIVLDVKTGKGAFMKTVDEARELAKQLVSIGKKFGKKVVAVLSNMDQPLGQSVGNALEVEEAIRVMQGSGPTDVVELCLALGSQLMVKAGASPNVEDATRKLSDALENGDVLKKFKQLVEWQGGDPNVVDDPRGVLPIARFIEEIDSYVHGYIRQINAEEIGVAARYLGAGRTKVEDKIDPAAGILIARKVGDYVRAGQPLVQMRTGDAHMLAVVRALVEEAFQITDIPHEEPPLVYDIIE